VALGIAHMLSPGLHATAPSRITDSETRVLSPLLSDGQQIYFPQYDNGRFEMAAVPIGGGATTVVDTGLSNPELDDISPDGQLMLLRNLDHARDELAPLYFRAHGGSPRRVGNVLAYDAAWYPGAKRILYSSDGIIFSTDPEGKYQGEQFRVPGNAFWFRWSPDRTMLRFTVIDKKNEETSLWEFREGDSTAHRLFPDLPFHLCCGTWTPDGRFYLFQARSGSGFQIWAARDQHGWQMPFGKRPFSLISGPASYRGPLPGIDGKTLFVRAEVPKGEAVQFDALSGKFLPILPSISPRTLAFSPDGKKVAYSNLADNNLWRCNSDGTDCVQLTRHFRNTAMPRWSPDGQTIAFMAVTFQGNWGIYTVADNGGLIRSLSDGKQAEGSPDWSPDGQRIAFGEVPPVSRPSGIHIFDLRSGGLSMVPSSAEFFSPRWSPDGQSLVAVHVGDQHPYLFNLHAGRWRQLAEVSCAYPSWSHDGRFIYFLSETRGTRVISRASVAEGTVETVVSLAGTERGPFLFGDWIGLAPNDTPIAVRNLTDNDIYVWTLSRE
jgi:Tol biopolymer transport system component